MRIKPLINSMLRPTSLMLANHLLVNRNEADVFAAQKNLLQNAPVRTILDLGAHIGKTAKTYRKTFPEATIHCFEPTEATFHKLTERTKSDKKVVRHMVAVSNGLGQLEFNQNSQASTNSIHSHPIA